MTLSTSARAITIKDNLINIGFSSTGTSAANYTYASNVALGGDAIISGNTFTGCIGNGIGATNLVTITSGSSIVTNNNFIRGVGSPVTAYIAVTSASDQVIKDNIFDQSTVNGSSDVLVVGISSRTVYISNKNQTVYVPFQITTSGRSYLTDFSQAFFSNGFFAPAGSFPAIPQEIFVSGTDTITVQMETNLGMMLPDGVKLLEIKFGLLRDGDGVVNTGANYNAFELNINIWDTVKANYATGTGSIMDIAATAPLFFNTYKTTTSTATKTILFNSGTAWADILSAEVYYDLDLSANNYCVNNRDYLILAHMQYDMKFSSGASSLFISPLVAKCIW